MRIPEEAREAHVLSLFLNSKIKKIYAARHLSAASLRRVIQVAPSSCPHYQVVEKLLSLEGWSAWEDLIGYAAKQPFEAAKVVGRIDSGFLGCQLASAAIQAPKEEAARCRYQVMMSTAKTRRSSQAHG